MDGERLLAPSSARQLAIELMDAHGLRDWSFAFNRAKRTMGLCRHHQRRIELSVYFVLSNDAASVRDCILHEIAHALAGLTEAAMDSTLTKRSMSMRWHLAYAIAKRP